MLPYLIDFVRNALFGFSVTVGILTTPLLVFGTIGIFIPVLDGISYILLRIIEALWALMLVLLVVTIFNLIAELVYFIDYIFSF